MSELLRATDLTKRFKVPGTLFRARYLDVLNGVSLSLNKGEALGLVGESGSGKTTLARCLVGMLQPDSGTVEYDGQDMHRADSAQRKVIRSDLSFVYQNPYLSLNPRFTLGELVAEPLLAQGQWTQSEINDRVTNLLAEVGLSDIAVNRRINALSGGQAQRIAIARALALEPRLIVLDEPTSALDVSVQAQVLNLLVSLRQSTGCSYLFITHDLDVVNYMCERVLVMHKGIIVESGLTENVLQAPAHAYTKTLIASTPTLGNVALPAKQEFGV